MRLFKQVLLAVSGLAAMAGSAFADDEQAKLAKQLSNPISSLISVPFQFNYDDGYGPTGDGSRTTMNLQPVVPISLGDNWNLISRTIIPIIDQSDIVPGQSDSGVGDVLQSFFFSPKAEQKVIWGVGPAFLLPTGGDNLGADQFAAGLTGVVLKQSGHWTYGALANHLWDVGGGSGATDISATFFQPFVAYNTPNAWTFALNTESSYDWVAEEASIPINITAAKLVKLGGKLPVQIGGGLRYWADSPQNGPDGWGARFSMTFLFPKGGKGKTQ